MAFYPQPTYNLTVNIWRHGRDPSVDPPDVVSLANLAWGRRGGPAASGGTDTRGVVFTAPQLLLPKLTDIRSDEKSNSGDDIVECPAASGRFYTAAYVEDLGKGFSNEHRGALLIPSPPWPEPYP